MKIRALKDSDIPVIAAWHRQRRLPYLLPDLRAGNVVRAEVMTEDDGTPVQVLVGMKTVEMYMLSDPDWGTPRKRLLALQVGHESFRKWLHEHGWTDVFAVLPPAFARAFGRRLQQLFGWNHGPWEHFSRKTAGE